MQPGRPQRHALLRLLSRAPRHDSRLPPAIIVSGGNALSVARSLSQAGVAVYGLHLPEERLRYSRHCTWLPVPVEGTIEESWTRYLLGPESEWLRGAVLIPCSDSGIEILNNNYAALKEKYRLDEANPQAQLSVLNKLDTYLAAEKADVPVPRFWRVHSLEDLHRARAEMSYPLIIKPHLSHVFTERFAKKLLIVRDFEQLLDAYRPIADSGVEVMLVEMVPGPDDRLCSYYTYLDEDGNALFDFTKRVIRRFPILMGNGCCHVTDWVPDLKHPALRLTRRIGLRGLVNVEFKLDSRDGGLKLIECNARITAANMLVAASGYDLPLFVYNRIVGRPMAPLGKYKLGKRLWYPLDDFYAFLQLRRQGALTTGQWLRGVLRPSMLPYFLWTDPLPSVVHEFRRVRDGVGRLLKRILGRRKRPSEQAAPLPESITLNHAYGAGTHAPGSTAS